MRRHALKLAKLATWPAEVMSATVGKVIPHDRKKGKVIAGVCLMLTGAQMSACYPVGCVIPHCVYDACAWFLHACGCTPVIEAYCDRKKRRKEARQHARNPQRNGQSPRCDVG